MNAKFLVPWAALVAAPLASADILTPVQRFFGTGNQLPESAEFGDQDQRPTDSDYAPFSPADSDLGVQEILAAYTGRSPVILDFATAFYRTDNAPSGSPLTDEPAWLWLGRASASWRPRLAGGWFGDAGITEEILRFDDSGATDYENFVFRLGAFKVLPQLDDLLLFGRYEFQRLTTGSFRDGDYQAQRVRAGVQKTLYASPHHEFSLGLSGGLDFTAKPESLERDDLTVEAAYRWFIRDDLYLLTSWRTAAYDFHHFGRDDMAHGFGLELIWHFTSDARAHVSLFYDKNDSNTPLGLNDYESWTSGIGAGVIFRF